MRRISAHYVFTGDGPVLRNGIITVDSQGCILDVTDTRGQLIPSEKLEHLNGILTPALSMHTVIWSSPFSRGWYPSTLVSRHFLPIWWLAADPTR
jgi:hypothetical protein